MHSPGPWTAEQHKSPARVIDATGECIAMVYLTDQKTRRRDDKHRANLQTMLAAPELVAALKECVAEFAALDEGKTVTRRALAIIAKAEGCDHG